MCIFDDIKGIRNSTLEEERAQQGCFSLCAMSCFPWRIRGLFIDETANDLTAAVDLKGRPICGSAAGCHRVPQRA